MLRPGAVLLLVVASMSVTSSTDDAVVPVEGGCDIAQVLAGLCDGGGGDELEIEGEETEGGGSDPGGPGAPAPEPPPEADPRPDGESPDGDDGGWSCLDGEGNLIGPGCVDDPPPEDDDEPEDIPEISWRDVASFAPVPSAPAIEPFGVAIARAPMNVAIAAAPHTVGGELFGHPMAVTFTPELFTIDYGDGTTLQTADPAPTWVQLGQEQLTPTATSHVYAERGMATVTVEISYSATVDFGALGVHPVNGFIVSAGSPVDVRIHEKQSYLVDGACAENPTAPGC